MSAARAETGPSSPGSVPIARGGRVVLLLWLVALAAGVALRLPFLLAETPHFDEWHPLLAVKRQGFERLATTFGIACSGSTPRSSAYCFRSWLIFMEQNFGPHIEQK